MRRPFEIPHVLPTRAPARGAWLAMLALASTLCGVAGLVEADPGSTGHPRWSCTRSGSLVEVHPDSAGVARACTARELHDGGMWKGVL
jgi:hypothetical protein